MSTVDQMTAAEKIRMMENLWDDLCRHAQDIPSPSWHRDVLLQRENALSKGELTFTDWENAKKKIRETI